jgi:hypothetical protein
MDPFKQGRIQVRVFGIHDNESLIPDSDLRWATASLPINSGASYRGVGASPVGVIPGTVVDGYFGDADRTILIATGILPSAGRTRTGEIVDGSYALDQSYNDVANSARGIDLNAALGLKNLPALSQVGAVFPAISAGLGPLTDHTTPALQLMSEVDPLNMSGSMANSVNGFSKSYAINSLSDLADVYPGGITGITQTLILLQTGAFSITSLPLALQAIVGSYPGGLSSLISLTTILSSVLSVSMLGSSSQLISQAISVGSNLSGSLPAVLEQTVASLVMASKRREFALEAAVPVSPELPDTPSTTSSTASVASGNSKSRDPYANLPSVELPPPVTSADYLNTLIDKPQENAAVTTGDVLRIAPAEPAPVATSSEIVETGASLENQNIMDQIKQQDLENRTAQDAEQQRAIVQVLQQY